MKRTAASWEYMRMLKMYPDTLFQTRSNKLRLLGRKVLRNWNTKSGRGYSRHHQHTDVMNPAWGPQTKARGQWQCLQGRCEQNRENKGSARPRITPSSSSTQRAQPCPEPGFLSVRHARIRISVLSNFSARVGPEHPASPGHSGRRKPGLFCQKLNSRVF